MFSQALLYILNDKLYLNGEYLNHRQKVYFDREFNVATLLKNREFIK